MPDFSNCKDFGAPELRARIADRVRIERRRLGLSQAEFARECRIPLRTYKRFEQGQCDSLEAFLRIVKIFERTAAIELLFPPKASTLPDAKSLISVFERLVGRVHQAP